ncbi:conserved hypothetical protein [Neospora caninum Liverpool]|uniref:Uncharacterized protein n=1 Tax=Neospora caninum (strain Liverpool) TaxID=572307 RepID=F0VBW1_NEOCL|nr:conserved hypothetical protein [Neospora caninum Liverpool]CBZ51095.1 conserved hypothetical protein [Neospora caninum Liverpool]CEL68402.1 TPA: hypothetical protein BN1204_041700 [Neospora caninum Liverpool]|eukprot:XP_003881128.1 conserved hypothetical protein [Neospora caninum Liverpool]
MAGSQAASFRDQAWFPRSLKECAAGNASLRETFVCHFCGNPFSSFSLFPHLRTCKEKARNLQKKGRRTPIAAPPDVPATSEWREEYNAWARDIVEHQDLLTLCQLCGHGVLQNRMSTHLWKCSVNSREAHAHRHALTRVLAAPFSPYEEKTVDRRPREAQMRSGNPANASRTNTHFHQPLLLSAVEALCRESGEAHGERGRKPGRIRACPRLPTERSKGCTSAQRQTPVSRICRLACVTGVRGPKKPVEEPTQEHIYARKRLARPKVNKNLSFSGKQERLKRISSGSTTPPSM